MTVKALVERGFPANGGEVPNFGRHDLARLFGELGFAHGAEIGVERGKYSEVLLEQNPHLRRLHCVDPWRRYGRYRDHVSQAKLDGFLAETSARLSRFGDRFEIFRGFSLDAARQFEPGSLDFVYIDANHDFANVVLDIAAWLPRVRPGGIISGHDYIRRNKDVSHHVVQAVKAWADCYKVSPWWVLGRRARRDGETRDKNRSWMWVV